jgi:2,4-dienoyl-CoA reductase-like NADH-dependent reductase (Old Yellow Enzyme family)
VPAQRPLLVRLSATEWVDGGWSPEETVDLALILGARGVDLLDVTSGGSTRTSRSPSAPGTRSRSPGRSAGRARCRSASSV